MSCVNSRTSHLTTLVVSRIYSTMFITISNAVWTVADLIPTSLLVRWRSFRDISIECTECFPCSQECREWQMSLS